MIKLDLKLWWIINVLDFFGGGSQSSQFCAWEHHKSTCDETHVKFDSVWAWFKIYGDDFCEALSQFTLILESHANVGIWVSIINHLHLTSGTWKEPQTPLNDEKTVYHEDQTCEQLRCISTKKLVCINIRVE